MGAGIAAGVARRLALVAAEIVEDGDIAAIEGWCQALLDPGGEGNAVDRAIEHEGRDDAVVAQSGEEGQRLPMMGGRPRRHRYARMEVCSANQRRRP